MSKLISRDMLPMVDLKGQYAILQNEILSGFQEVLEKTQFFVSGKIANFVLFIPFTKILRTLKKYKNSNNFGAGNQFKTLNWLRNMSEKLIYFNIC